MPVPQSTDLVARLRNPDRDMIVGLSDSLCIEAAEEIERLRAEGTKRLNWLLGLIDHAQTLGRSYAADWHVKGLQNDE